jgi:WD40 repeat protein/energy-coupling factor transporter ATP-binding protein EcfA2
MSTETTYLNPFPGLRSFEENEDVLFFGREKQVDELLRKLRTVRFLAVIGSSGSGKSSLVKSGLIPSLFSGFMSGAGSDWRMCTFRPGNDPIGNMAKGLVENNVLYDDKSPEEILTLTSITESILRRSSQGLAETYKQSGLDTKNNLLILVDQFEELFRFSKYEKDAKEGKRDSVAFINLLLKASEQRDVPIYIVFTMRSDFLGDCTEFRGFPEAINEGQYLVPRMTRDERKDAITGPVAVGGGTITPRLLNQLLNDVGDNPDQLPILQHALMRTWDTWKKKDASHPIDITDYEEIGTMRHALSQHAEEAFEELTTDKQKHICEVLFKALTDRGSDARGIRRPRKLTEICALAEAPMNEVIEVINVFRKRGRAFLMPPENVKLNESSIIDISHESLMRVWDRLIEWVDEENESAQIYLRLCEAADLYETGRGGLWRDPELQVAWKWKEEHKPNATWASRYNSLYEKAILFLEHSKEQYELRQKHKEEMQKRRLRRAKRTAIVISLVAIGAMFLSIYAFQQKNVANKQTQIATDQTKEAKKQKDIAVKQTVIAEQNKEQAVQQKELAVKSEKVAVEQKEIANAEKTKAEKSEQNAILQKTIAEAQKSKAERQTVIADSNAKVAKEQKNIAETQTVKAVENENKAISEQKVSTRLKDLAESRNMAYESLILLNDKRYDESKTKALQAFQLNNKNDGPKQNSDIYNALHNNWMNSIGYKNQSSVHKYPVHCITGKPNSDIVFTADESGAVILSNLVNNTLQPLEIYSVKEEARALAASPDGSKLVVLTTNGNGIVLNVTSTNGFTLASKFVFKGIGKQLAFIDNSNFILLSSAGIGKYKLEPAVVEESFLPVNISSIISKNGKLYAAIGNKINLYNNWDDVVKGNVVNSFTANSTITSIAVDANEQYIAAGTYDGGVWIKDMKSSITPFMQTLHQSSVNDVKFAKVDGDKIQLATAGADQTIRLIDVKSALQKGSEDIIKLTGHTKWVYQLYYKPDGNLLISTGEDSKVITWKPTMNDIYQTLNKK